MTNVFYYKDCPIRYTDVGSGPPVVLLHGFAETGAVWRYQTDFLQKNYRIIVPEIPGSDWQQLAPPLERLGRLSSIDAMADALAALIQKISTEPVVLLGHSMGGYTTLALAKRHPQLLKAFGLIHSTAFADSEEKKETRRKGIAFIRKNGAEAFFKTSAPGLFSEASKERNPEWLKENIAMAIPFDPEVLVANYEAMIARPDRTHVLSGSGVPVLFVIGKDDKAAPAADVLQQVYLPPISYFHLLGNVAHMGIWEAADKVNDIIYKFLEDCG